MTENAVITIKSVHDSAEDPFEFITDGYYSFENNVGSIRYEESLLTGMEGTQTFMQFLPDRILLNREGTVTSTMLFQKGIVNSMPYDTPFGSTMMGLDTKQIRQEFNPDGGKAEIEYVLGIKHKQLSRVKMSISVEKQGV